MVVLPGPVGFMPSLEVGRDTGRKHLDAEAAHLLEHLLIILSAMDSLEDQMSLGRREWASVEVVLHGTAVCIRDWFIDRTFEA